MRRWWPLLIAVLLLAIFAGTAAIASGQVLLPSNTAGSKSVPLRVLSLQGPLAQSSDTILAARSLTDLSGLVMSSRRNPLNLDICPGGPCWPEIRVSEPSLLIALPTPAPCRKSALSADSGPGSLVTVHLVVGAVDCPRGAMTLAQPVLWLLAVPASAIPGGRLTVALASTSSMFGPFAGEPLNLPSGQTAVDAASASTIACRLPVVVPTSDPTFEPLGGWVFLPGGEFQRDPRSRPTLMNHLPSYDWPLHRWVPVESMNVSPDGMHYVVEESGSFGTFDLVDAQTGSRQAIYSTTGYRRVVAYRAEGIYLTDTGIKPSAGLWLVNPSTGTEEMVRGSERYPEWQLVGEDAAWTVTGSEPQTVLRLDLASGAISAWYQSALPIGLLALDGQGRPVISLLGNSLQVGLLLGANQLMDFKLPGRLEFSGIAYAARSQVWLSLQRDEGIALFSGKPDVEVFKTQTGPYAFTAAGGCF